MGNLTERPIPSSVSRAPGSLKRPGRPPRRTAPAGLWAGVDCAEPRGVARRWARTSHRGRHTRDSVPAQPGRASPGRRLCNEDSPAKGLASSRDSSAIEPPATVDPFSGGGCRAPRIRGRPISRAAAYRHGAGQIDSDQSAGLSLRRAFGYIIFWSRRAISSCWRSVGSTWFTQLFSAGFFTLLASFWNSATSCWWSVT